MNTNSPKWKFSGYIECRISIIMLCIQKLVKDCWIKVHQIFRSKQRLEFLHKKDVLKTFSNSQKKKHLCRSLSFNKNASAVLLKRDPNTGVFSFFDFFKNSKATFFTEHLWMTAFEKIRYYFYYVRPHLVESMFMVNMIT